MQSANDSSSLPSSEERESAATTTPQVRTPSPVYSSAVSAAELTQRQGKSSEYIRFANGLRATVHSAQECGSLASYAFSHDGSRLATGGPNGSIQLWSTSDFSRSSHLCADVKSDVCAVAFLNGSNDSVHAVSATGLVTRLDFSPDGNGEQSSSSIRLGGVPQPEPPLPDQSQPSSPGSRRSPLEFQFSADGCTLLHVPRRTLGLPDEYSGPTSISKTVLLYPKGNFENPQAVNFEGCTCCLPVLAKNGQRVLAVCAVHSARQTSDVRSGVSQSTRPEPVADRTVVQVWTSPSGRLTVQSDHEHVLAQWADEGNAALLHERGPNNGQRLVCFDVVQWNMRWSIDLNSELLHWRVLPGVASDKTAVFYAIYPSTKATACVLHLNGTSVDTLFGSGADLGKSPLDARSQEVERVPQQNLFHGNALGLLEEFEACNFPVSDVSSDASGKTWFALFSEKDQAVTVADLSGNGSVLRCRLQTASERGHSNFSRAHLLPGGTGFLLLGRDGFLWQKFSSEGKTPDCVAESHRLPSYAKIALATSGMPREALATHLAENFERYAYDFSWGSGQLSPLEESIKNKDWRLAESMARVAERNGFESHVWDDAALEALRGKWKDQLRATDDSEEQLRLSCYEQLPFEAAAQQMTRVVDELINGNPDTLENADYDALKKLLCSEVLFRQVCQVSVDRARLDPVLRDSEASHLGVMQSTRWTAVVHPSCVEKFLNGKSGVDGEGERVDNGCTKKASLNVICLHCPARPGAEGLIGKLLTAEVPRAFYASEPVDHIVRTKWKTVWSKRLRGEFFEYVIFLALFTGYAWLSARGGGCAKHTKSCDVLPVLLLFGAYVFGGRFFAREFRRGLSIGGGELQPDPFRLGSWSGALLLLCSPVLVVFETVSRLLIFCRSCLACGPSKAHVRGSLGTSRAIWVGIDLISSNLLLLVIPVLHMICWMKGSKEKSLSVAIAVEAIVAYMKLWRFGLSSQKTALLVRLVVTIAENSFPFICLMFFLVTGFGIALHQLFQTANIDEELLLEVDYAFGTFSRTFISLFYAIFGSFNPELFHATGDLRYLTQGIFVLYLATQTIVTLNLVIAIMGDAFDMAKSLERTELLVDRASFMHSSELSLRNEDKRRMQLITTANVFAIHPVGGVGQRQQYAMPWPGRINEIKGHLEFRMGELRQQARDLVNRRMDAMEAKLEGVEQQLSHLTASIIEQRDPRTQ